jgi:hypothetical protein
MGMFPFRSLSQWLGADMRTASLAESMAWPQRISLLTKHRKNLLTGLREINAQRA